MDDEADVRFIDPHAEGDGRANHLHLIAQKKFLVFRSLLVWEARVVSLRGEPFFRKALGEALARFTTLAVDDAAFPLSVFEKLDDLLRGRVFVQHAVGQVCTVETADEGVRVRELELLDDVLPHTARGGGGERHEGNIGQLFAELRDLPILGAEIVAPLGDAVRFVDGDELDIPLPQFLQKRRHHQPLRGDVEQAILAIEEPREAEARFFFSERGVQKCGRYARRDEGIDLIFHQRDER